MSAGSKSGGVPHIRRTGHNGHISHRLGARSPSETRWCRR
ncbi:hypothetical protein I549_2327 [Mycobacterium avium subsp. avium 2285 (R)]|uniref:Uncharacterized protein n=1 Tax=Mycobacterium avium (strain 104) TaxID=243243 RepID=A0A0H3A2Q2_MYCA1|nr:hypothetical protein MAV_3778 [Mycobacterium avium 104]ETZ47249.1 hypothetical protein L839_1350 [Mycobacterium avium MAV_120809_2495]ETZ50506.1 hypothetical protein L837_1270 [Mycobacterium avium MAV_061107_1842]ETZ58284.1 hypothetical protein L840_2770 [Mycobacterium sp. MAC_011194_8550]ETZ68370.1 hypothetical protein L841_2493 [Mycobacterium sp. MAC_080597_8934]EUA38036.1 hypothetical protein I549_2327 [Mycobacterium avium subsp. avium 2285 (R)]